MDSTTGNADGAMGSAQADADLVPADQANGVDQELSDLKALALKASQIASELQGQLNRLRCIVRRLDALRVMRQCERDGIDYITGEPR